MSELYAMTITYSILFQCEKSFEFRSSRLRISFLHQCGEQVVVLNAHHEDRDPPSATMLELIPPPSFRSSCNMFDGMLKNVPGQLGLIYQRQRLRGR